MFTLKLQYILCSEYVYMHICFQTILGKAQLKYFKRIYRQKRKEEKLGELVL